MYMYMTVYGTVACRCQYEPERGRDLPQRGQEN